MGPGGLLVGFGAGYDADNNRRAVLHQPSSVQPTDQRRIQQLQEIVARRLSAGEHERQGRAAGIWIALLTKQRVRQPAKLGP
jgi:hypothetical protein